MITTEDFKRVNNSANGSPRYVLHFLQFASDYDDALKIAKKCGFKVYRGKDYGGGFVCQTYGLQDKIERIEKNK